MSPELTGSRLPLTAKDHHDPGGGAAQSDQGALDGGCGRSPLSKVVPCLTQLGLHLHMG